MTKNDPPLREAAEGEQEMQFWVAQNGAVIGIIVTDGIWGVQIDLVVGQVFRICEICSSIW